MRNLIIFLACLLFIAAAFADKDAPLLPAADVAPDVGPASLYPPVDDQWDLVFWAGLPSWDYQHYGCEFAGGHFYITASGFPNWPNIVLILDRNGNWVGYFGQWSEPGWGWRDLAYDYTYLYGSDDTVIDAFDLEGNPVPEMNITGCPITPCRALAYDEVTDHFWTQSFSGPLHEIDRSGASLWSGSSGATAYGAAFDNAAPDGPWLWIFSSTGIPSTTFHKFDPINHVPTGFVYQLPLLPGSTDQIAGGLFFTEEWDPNYWVLGGITQGTPYDQLFCLEMYPNVIDTFDVTIDLTYNTWPYPNFDVEVTNNEAFTVTFDTWITVTLPMGLEITLVQRQLTIPAGHSAMRNLILNVPAHAPSGTYTVTGYTGDYPDIVWDSDFFTFDILWDGDGIFDPASFTLTGWDEPWEVVIKAPAFLHADVSPDAGPVLNYPPVDDQWDLLFCSNAGQTVNDNQLLGAEFAGEHFYITGGNNSLDPNKVYMLNSDGSYYDEFDQWSPPGWGWRDLTYGWMYLYACQTDIIYALDLDGNPVPSMNIYLPFSSCSALAYDPVTDHFWVVSGSELYEINRAGTVIWYGPIGGLSVSGLAWDDGAPDGPWLWMFCQSGSPPTTIHQYDPINHVITGFVYQLPLLPGSNGQVAGGLFFSIEWDPYWYVLGGLTQGTPEDQIFCLQMYWYGGPIPYNVVIEMDYVSGSPVPPGGGPVDYEVTITNNENFTLTFEAWITVELPSGSEIILAIRELTLQGGQGMMRSLTLNVPYNAPPGTYTLSGCTGLGPSILPWSMDSFTFEKLGAGDGIVDPASWTVSGWDDPSEATLKTVVPGEFTLLGNYPNPFNPTTSISFSLPEAARATLKVYDVSGRLVVELMDGWCQAGSHEVTFDASGLVSGVYIYRITSGDFTGTGKMVLMK